MDERNELLTALKHVRELTQQTDQITRIRAHYRLAYLSLKLTTNYETLIYPNIEKCASFQYYLNYI